jgi:hypothetical protein
MASWSPRSLLVGGALLVLVGWALPFLMVLRVIPPGFILSFLSYAALLAGMMMGLIGSLMYVRRRRAATGEGAEQDESGG